MISNVYSLVADATLPYGDVRLYSGSCSQDYKVTISYLDENKEICTFVYMTTIRYYADVVFKKFTAHVLDLYLNRKGEICLPTSGGITEIFKDILEKTSQNDDGFISIT